MSPVVAAFGAVAAAIVCCAAWPVLVALLLGAGLGGMVSGLVSAIGMVAMMIAAMLFLRRSRSPGGTRDAAASRSADDSDRSPGFR